MEFELKCLVVSALLGLAYILIAAQARTKELGVKWNVSARDGKQAELQPMTQRLLRAQANFFETYPLYIAAVIAVTQSHQLSNYSYYGSLLYLVARAIYLPLYAFGIPVFRTIVWQISMIGILLILIPALF